MSKFWLSGSQLAVMYLMLAMLQAKGLSEQELEFVNETLFQIRNNQELSGGIRD